MVQGSQDVSFETAPVDDNSIKLKEEVRPTFFISWVILSFGFLSALALLVANFSAFCLLGQSLCFRITLSIFQAEICSEYSFS